jgi:hypothetical protein
MTRLTHGMSSGSRGGGSSRGSKGSNVGGDEGGGRSGGDDDDGGGGDGLGGTELPENAKALLARIYNGDDPEREGRNLHNILGELDKLQEGGMRHSEGVAGGHGGHGGVGELSRRVEELANPSPHGHYSCSKVRK